MVHFHQVICDTPMPVRILAEERLHLAEIAAQPEDFSRRGQYADWLAAHDRPVRAEAVRLSAYLDETRGRDDLWAEHRLPAARRLEAILDSGELVREMGGNLPGLTWGPFDGWRMDTARLTLDGFDFTALSAVREAGTLRALLAVGGTLDDLRRLVGWPGLAAVGALCLDLEPVKDPASRSLLFWDDPGYDDFKRELVAVVYGGDWPHPPGQLFLRCDDGTAAELAVTGIRRQRPRTHIACRPQGGKELIDWLRTGRGRVPFGLTLSSLNAEYWDTRYDQGGWLADDQHWHKLFRELDGLPPSQAG